MLLGLFLTSAFYLCSSNHFSPWTGAKLYPAFATSARMDLYNLNDSPFILTVYGPGSSFFYLCSTIGVDPQSCMWIALSLNILSILFICHAIFFKSRKHYTLTHTYFGLSFLFFLTVDKTTLTLFQIHHDLPTLFYLFLFAVILNSAKKSSLLLLISFLVLWMTVWTKLVALPWCFLPFAIRFLSPGACPFLENFSFKVISFHLFCSGSLLLICFGCLYGFRDLYVHIIDTTNGYPWRECQSLFGTSEENLIDNSLSSKLRTLMKIFALYFIDYWWLLLSCILLLLHQVKSSKPSFYLVWLPLAYLLTLPTCLSALAKFGGIENSLLFAHFPAYAALFLKAAEIVEREFSSTLLKLGPIFLFAGILSLISFRNSKACRKDTSLSPMQLGYEYLIEKTKEPVLFAFSPLPNYLASGVIYDSGEALVYSTMMDHDLLPERAGTKGPLNIPLLAFSYPPYSKTFFERKFVLHEVPSPQKLKDWKLYKAIPKVETTTPNSQ